MDKYREFIEIGTRTECPDFLVSGNFDKDFENKDYQYAVIYYTDKVEVLELEGKELKNNLDLDKLLELRVFGKNVEYYLLKISEKEFTGRILYDKNGDFCKDSDETWEKGEAFDELHKLWKRCYPCKLDEDKIMFVRVRNYFNVEENLKFSDWRFVDFEVMEQAEVKKDERE